MGEPRKHDMDIANDRLLLRLFRSRTDKRNIYKMFNIREISKEQTHHKQAARNHVFPLKSETTSKGTKKKNDNDTETPPMLPDKT